MQYLHDYVLLHTAVVMLTALVCYTAVTLACMACAGAMQVSDSICGLCRLA